MTTQVTPQDVIGFWREAGPKKWFEPDPAFDAEIRERFLAAHELAAVGQLAEWESSAQGALALLLLLDQFPRNMFRKTARAFATDGHAREVAQRAIKAGFDVEVGDPMRSFFYLPFMHSEALADQELCLKLYRDYGNKDGIKFAEIHLDAIRRFGRFPHRNEILGRESSVDELAYLDSGGFRG
jgi:uncharacterized protein (DUF924 family)